MNYLSYEKKARKEFIKYFYEKIKQKAFLIKKLSEYLFYEESKWPR